MNNYKYHSPDTLLGDLEIMIQKTLLNYETLKNVIFNPYLKYREDIATHLKNYESDTIETHIKKYGSKYNLMHLLYDGHYSNNISSQLTNTLINNAQPIINKHKTEFIDDLKFMMRATYDFIVTDEEESNWAYFIIESGVNYMYEQDIFFQFKFTKLLRRLEEDYKNEVFQKLAFNKIKRNQIFILGLSMKLSMRDCGIQLAK